MMMPIQEQTTFPGNTAEKQYGDAGFTLVELMIVIAIIGILAAAAVFSYQRTRDKARIGACIATMDSIKTGMESYYTENNTYPPGPYSSLDDLAQELATFVNIKPEGTTCQWSSYEADANGAYYQLVMSVRKSTGTDVFITLNTTDLLTSE